MIKACTHAELRGGIDELELNLLKIPTRCVHHERLAESDNTLLGSRDRALHHDEVVLDDTIVGETTKGRDSLLGDISLRRGVVWVLATTNTVNLLVNLGTVVVSI
jgi:hypothetical protein